MPISATRKARFVLLAGTALTIATFAGPAKAVVNGTWDGSGATTTTSDWNTGTNWSSNPLYPVAIPDTATFTGAGNTNVTFSSGVAIGSLTIAGATPYSFSTNGNHLIVNGTISIAPAGNTFTANGGYMNFFTSNSFGATSTFAANNNGSLEFSGANTGTSTINLSTGGTVAFINGATSTASLLNLASNTTQATMLNAVTLGGIQGSGSIDFSGGGALTVGSNNLNSTFTGTLAGGANGLVKTGSGTTDLTGATLNYSGATSIAAGTLAVTTANLTGTGAVTNNGDLSFNQSANGTYSGAISGTGNVDINGTGTVTLGGASTYTGQTNVEAGTLLVGSATGIGTHLLNIASGATANANGNSFSVTALFGAGTFDTGAAGDVITVGNAGSGANELFSGTIQGAGSIVVGENTFTQTFSGTNTYSGGTTLQSGTLAFSTPANLGTGTLTFAGGTLQNTATTSLGLNATVDNAGGVIQSSGGNLTYSGIISGSGALTLDGTNAGHTIVFSAANTYTGGTNLQNGANVEMTTYGLIGYGQLQLTGNSTLNLNGLSQAAVTLSGTAGSTILLNGAGLIISGVGTGTASYAGTITDGASAGYLTFGNNGSQTGTQVLSGANTYSGGTTLNSGILSISSPGNISDAIAGSHLTFNGGTLRTTAGLNSGGAGALTEPIALGANGTIDTAGQADTVSGLISGSGSLTVASSIAGGVLSIANANNTYSGGTTVNSGMASIASAGALGAGALTLNGGAFQTNASLNFANSIILGTAGGLINASANNTTLSGNITGSGALNLTGSTITLSGTNTYTGPTTILGSGIVNIASGSNLGAAPVTLSQGRLQATANLTLNQNIVLTGGTFDAIDTGANTVISTGIISDTGGAGIAKYGLGTLILTGANTYGSEAPALVMGQTLPQTLIQAGTLQGTTSNIDGMVVDNAALVFAQSGNGTFANTISGTGSVTVTGGSTISLAGANTYSGGTNINGSTLALNALGNIGTGTVALNGGTLQVAAANLTLSQAVALNAGGGIVDTEANNETLSGVISGPGTLSKNGAGTLTLTGTNTYTGATILNGGVISIADKTNVGPGTNEFAFNGGTLQTTAGLNFGRAVLLAPGSGTVDTAGNNSGLAGAITGPGSLTKIGDGVLALSSTRNTYSGGTNVQAGTLQIAANNAAGTGPLTVASNATVTLGTFSQAVSSLSGNGTVVSQGGTFSASSGDFTGMIGSTGTFNKVDSPTLTLNGGNEFGATTVSGGTLAVGDAAHASASLFSPVTVTAGGTLMGHGTVVGTLSNSGIVQPGGSIGTLILDGNYTQASAGTLAIELSPNTSSRLAVNGSAGLAGTLALLPEPGIYTPGTHYTILTATNGVTGTFGTVTEGGSSVLFTETYTPNAVLVNVAGVLTPNEASAEGAINALLPGSTGSFAGALAVLAQAPASAVQRASLAGVLGELRSDIGTIDLANLTSFQNFIVERMDQRQGLSSMTQANNGLPGTFDVAMNDTDVPMLGARPGYPKVATSDEASGWVHGYGVLGDAGQQTGFQDFEYQTGGIVAGIDKRVTDTTLLGGAIGYEHTDFHLSADPGTSNTIDTYRVTVYGSQRLDPALPLVLDAAFGYAYNQYRDNDGLSGGNFAFNQNSKHNGNELTAETGISHAFAVNQTLVDGALTVVPRLGVEYDNIQQDHYRTTGAPIAAANLDTNGSTLNALRSTVGAKVDLKTTTSGGTVITHELRAAYLHDFEDTNTPLTESFTGAPASGFRIAGVHPGREAALVGGGVGVGFTNNVSVTLGYDAAVREHELDHTVQLGAKYTW